MYKKDSKRKKRLKVLMDYTFNICFDVSGAFISENKKAALLYDLPNSKYKNIFFLTLYDIKLAFSAIDLNRIFKIMKR